MCVCVLEILVLKNFKLRDYFERLLCWLDHWLSCMLDCIHICVFLLSKNCFEKLAWHLLDSFSIPGWINRASILGSDSLLLDTCSIPQLSTTIFSTPTSTASSTPLDTSSVEHYWRVYIYFLARFISHFFDLSQSVRACSSPKHSHFTSIVFLKVSSSFFMFFYTWVSF